MDIKPYWDRLIAALKNAIVEFTTIAISFFVALVVADLWATRYGAFWFMTVVAVYVACSMVFWLLRRAWSRYRRSPN
jgi:hypothetical protein